MEDRDNKYVQDHLFKIKVDNFLNSLRLEKDKKEQSLDIAKECPLTFRDYFLKFLAIVEEALPSIAAKIMGSKMSESKLAALKKNSKKAGRPPNLRSSRSIYNKSRKKALELIEERKKLLNT